MDNALRLSTEEISLCQKKYRSFKLVPVASSGLLQVSSVPHKGTLNSRHLSENSCLQTLKKKRIVISEVACNSKVLLQTL